jgi:hypothetical protein
MAFGVQPFGISWWRIRWRRNNSWASYLALIASAPSRNSADVNDGTADRPALATTGDPLRYVGSSSLFGCHERLIMTKKPPLDSIRAFAHLLFNVKQRFVDEHGREPTEGDELFPNVANQHRAIATLIGMMRPLKFEPALIESVRAGIWNPIIISFMEETVAADLTHTLADYTALVDDFDEEEDGEDDEDCCLHLSFFDSDDSILNAISNMKAAFVERSVGELMATGAEIEIVEPKAEADVLDEDDPDAWSIHIHGELEAISELLGNLEGLRLAPRGTLMVPTQDDVDFLGGGDEWQDVVVVSTEELRGSILRGPEIEGGVWSSLRITQAGKTRIKWIAKVAAFARVPGGHILVSSDDPNEFWLHFPDDEAKGEFKSLFDKNRGRKSSVSVANPDDRPHLVEVFDYMNPSEAEMFLEEYVRTAALLLSPQDGKSGKTN